MSGGKNILWLAVGTATALALPALADNADGSNPYHSIVVRNVFSLKPVPPPPPPKNDVQVEPPPDVLLKGLTTILEYPQAIFQLTPKGKPAMTQILTDGERYEGLEVVKINMAERSAKIVLDGKSMVLPLNVPKAGAGGGAVAAVGGGGPGAMPRVMTPGGGRGNFTPLPNVPQTGQPFAAGGGPAGSRLGYNPGSASSSGAAIMTTASTATDASGSLPAVSLPSRAVRTDTSAASTGLSPEQQVILIEAQRAQALQDNNPIAKILPPTPLTQQVLQENGTQQQAAPTFPSLPSLPVPGTRASGTLAH